MKKKISRIKVNIFSKEKKRQEKRKAERCVSLYMRMYSKLCKPSSFKGMQIPEAFAAVTTETLYI